MKLAHIAEIAQRQQISDQCYYPRMPQIDITVEGVRKLLSSLKPYKAAGPDSLTVHPRVLKELSIVIAPALICARFSEPLSRLV